VRCGCDLYTIQSTVAFCFPSTLTLNTSFCPNLTTLSTSHHSPQRPHYPQHATLHNIRTTPFTTHLTLHNTPHYTLHITPHTPHHITHYTPQASLSELKPRGTLSGQVPERKLLSSKLEFKFNSALSNLCSDSPSWSINWRRPHYNWGRSMSSNGVAYLTSWQHDTVGRLSSSRGAA